MLEQYFVNMFYTVFTFILVSGHVLSTDLQNSVNLLIVESCNYGDTVENVCNKCVCTTGGVYECQPRDCQAVQEIYLNKPDACHAKKVYNQGLTRCICTPEGQWPHKNCHDTFGDLPQDSTTTGKCEPGGYARVDCNVCRCNDKGEVDHTRCTVNECDLEKPKNRKKNGRRASLFGQCLQNNWYSMEPCQFCYCVEVNKLICSTGVVQTNRQGQTKLGSATLTLCGVGLLKDIAALVPNQRKLRSYLSSKEEHSMNNLNAIHNQIIEVTTTQEYHKAVTSNAARHDQLEMEYYDEYNNKVDGNENKINPQDIAASFNKHRRFGDPPVRDNDPFGAGRKILTNRRTLTLDPNSNCKPGSPPVTVKCNYCHCLRNGKLLCTDNKCD